MKGVVDSGCGRAPALWSGVQWTPSRAHRRSSGNVTSFLAVALTVVAALALLERGAAAQTPDSARAAAEAERSRTAEPAPAAQPAPAADPAADLAADPAAEHARLLGEIERALAEGKPADAVEPAERALGLAEKLADPTRVGVTRSLRAQLFAAQGELARAQAEFEAAAAALASFPALAAANRLNQANLLARDRRSAEAIAAYRAVAEEAEKRGDAVLALRAQVNAWRVRAESSPANLASDEGRRLVQAILDLPEPVLRASLAIHFARSLELAREAGATRERAWLLEGHRALTAALAAADEARSTALRAEALGHLGTLYEAEGRLEEAASLTDRALAQVRRSEGAATSARWQLQAGRLRRGLGEFEAALAHHAEAVAIVGRPGASARAARPSSGGRSAFESEDAAAYRGYVDLLLRRAALQKDEARRTADLRQAQSVLESYRVAELKDYFADDCVDRRGGSRARVDQAAGSFVVLYPVILEDRVELLVSRRDWIERRSVPIGRVELEKLARQYRGLLEDRTTRLYLRPAQALHRALIAPIQDLLDQQAPETLVVVPDGVLRTIPFAALHDGERHLVERYALATTPSLELSDAHPFDRSDVGSLYGGLTTAVQGFDALPQVQQEIETANRFLPGKVMLDESFSRGALVSELSTRSFDLVHVASHAEFSSADRGGFLLTHDGKLQLGEFRRAVELLQYRERPLELLVLSACETAAGDERAALGFSGAAIQAGARSVLGSLWLVQDEATSVLLATFYEALADPKLSRAQAMQRAQRRLIEDPAYAHPSSWAAFMLINSWL
jgi:CHAT domain-containing protein